MCSAPTHVRFTPESRHSALLKMKLFGGSTADLIRVVGHRANTPRWELQKINTFSPRQ
jgi:hypothetical protein